MLTYGQIYVALIKHSSTAVLLQGLLRLSRAAPQAQPPARQWPTWPITRHATSLPHLASPLPPFCRGGRHRGAVPTTPHQTSPLPPFCRGGRHRGAVPTTSHQTSPLPPLLSRQTAQGCRPYNPSPDLSPATAFVEADGTGVPSLQPLTRPLPYQRSGLPHSCYCAYLLMSSLTQRM